MAKFELTYSSAGDFLTMPFAGTDSAWEAAVFWNRKIADIPQETIDRWKKISQEYYAMREEQRLLYQMTPSNPTGVLFPGG